MRNKLGLGNILGGLGTSFLTLFTIMLCSVGVAVKSPGLIMFGGLLVLLSMFLNVVGIGVGIAAAYLDRKDWKSWAGLGLHILNLSLWVFLHILSMIARHSQQSHWIE